MLQGVFVRRGGSERKDEPGSASLVSSTPTTDILEPHKSMTFWSLNVRTLNLESMGEFYPQMNGVHSETARTLNKAEAPISAIWTLTVNLTHCHYRTYLQNSVFSSCCKTRRKSCHFLEIKVQHQQLAPTQHFVRQISSGSNIVNMSLCICLVLTNWNPTTHPPTPPPEATYRLPKSVIPPSSPSSSSEIANKNTLYFHFISKT